MSFPVSKVELFCGGSEAQIMRLVGFRLVGIMEIMEIARIFSTWFKG
jgi:hypothetical protein